MTSSYAIADGESSEGNILDDVALLAIIQEYRSGLVFPAKQQPWLLCAIGLVGVGKSTIMKQLCVSFGLVRVVSDDIRSLVGLKGYNYERMNEVFLRLISELLAEGYAVGVDADCVKEQERILAYAGKASIRVTWIHVTAPEDVILARLQEDNLSREYRGPQAIADYWRRKPLHAVPLLVQVAYTFRTEQLNSAEQLVEAEEAIRQDLKNS